MRAASSQPSLGQLPQGWDGITAFVSVFLFKVYGLDEMYASKDDF